MAAPRTNDDRTLNGSVLLAAVTILTACLVAPSAPCEVITDGSLGPARAVSGPDFAVTHDLGQIRGGNLFHSFSQFNLATGESATFSGPETVQNIISRVTGGNPSNVDGLIRSTISGANLYLMNPSGVVFGPNAELDVQGSFHATTADYLRLGDEGVFYADLGKESVLSVAPVSSFGFLAENPAPISLQGSNLGVPDYETFTLAGGDIDLVGAVISAAGGRIDVASVGSPGEVVPTYAGQVPALDVSGHAELGSIRLSEGSELNAGGDGGGTVLIRGGRLLVDGSYVYASTKGPSVGPLVGEPGAGIDIDVRESVVLDNNAQLGTNVFVDVGEGIGSGGVRVRADQMEIRNGARIQSVVYQGSTGGDSGDIDIGANRVSIHDGGFIQPSTGGFGKGGNAIIRADDIEIRDGGSVYSLAFGEAPGDNGDIVLDAKRVSLSNPEGAAWTAISSQWLSGAQGKGGDVRITATESLDIVGGGIAEISSWTTGGGNAGKVEIATEKLSISGAGKPGVFTGIQANTRGSGAGGSVTLNAKTVELTKGSTVQAISFGSGPGGAIQVHCDDLSAIGLTDPKVGSGFLTYSTGSNAGGSLSISAKNITFSHRGIIQSFASGSGKGGDIELNAETNVALSDLSYISANTMGDGGAGNTNISAANLSLQEGSQIFIGSSGKGKGGNLNITADQLSVIGVENVTDSQSGVFGNCSGMGDAGDINITANNLLVTHKGQISADSKQSGNGGMIKIQVSDTFQATRGGSIEAVANGSGSAGDIDLTADTVILSGVSDEPFVDASGKNLLQPSIITTQTTFGGGSAGDIRLSVRDLHVLDGARIDAETGGAGDGGNIIIEAQGDMIVSGANERQKEFAADPANPRLADAARSMIVTMSNSLVLGDEATGNAGDIRIEARDLAIRDQGMINSETWGPGRGGNIEVVTSRTSLSGDARVIATSSVSPNAGKAGEITIEATEAFESEGSVVSTSADDAPGGGVSITAGEVALSAQSVVSAESSGKGNAGSIAIEAKDRFVSSMSSVTTEAKQADGGNIEIRADGAVDLIGSEVTASVSGGTGKGGTVVLVADRLGVSGSAVAATTNSTGAGGNVRIEARELEVEDGGSLSVRSTSAGGAGSVEVAADLVTLRTGAEVTAAASGEGEGGAIRIDAAERFESDGGVVTSSAERSRGGDIAITAPDVLLKNGASVSAESSGQGNAGSIAITAADTLRCEDSSVTTQAKQADGGNIDVRAGEMIHLVGSQVTASVGGGAETTGGNVTVDPEFVVLQESRIAANAFEGRGGNIRIRAGTFLADPASTVDASSAKGIDGTVDIEALVGELSGSLVPLSGNFRSAADLLREPCVARVRGGEYSSFIVGGRDGLPIEPGGLLPSPPY